MECNKIFESRKDEMLQELDKIEERQQEYELYQESKLKLIQDEQAKLDKKRSEVNTIFEKSKQLKDEADRLYKKNKAILKNIQDAKSDKIAQTYKKMKDSKAAGIFNVMQKESAAKILFSLPASKISKILAKMDPQVASDITNLINSNKAFENNSSILNETSE
jgi:flagellar motility protein MotE (MotC chaperone)